MVHINDSTAKQSYDFKLNAKDPYLEPKFIFRFNLKKKHYGTRPLMRQSRDNSLFFEYAFSSDSRLLFAYPMFFTEYT